MSYWKRFSHASFTLRSIGYFYGLSFQSVKKNGNVNGNKNGKGKKNEGQGWVNSERRRKDSFFLEMSWPQAFVYPGIDTGDSDGSFFFLFSLSFFTLSELSSSALRSTVPRTVQGAIVNCERALCF